MTHRGIFFFSVSLDWFRFCSLKGKSYESEMVIVIVNCRMFIKEAKKSTCYMARPVYLYLTFHKVKCALSKSGEQ